MGGGRVLMFVGSGACFVGQRGVTCLGPCKPAPHVTQPKPTWVALLRRRRVDHLRLQQALQQAEGEVPEARQGAQGLRAWE